MKALLFLVFWLISFLFCPFGGDYRTNLAFSEDSESQRPLVSQPVTPAVSEKVSNLPPRDDKKPANEIREIPRKIGKSESGVTVRQIKKKDN